MQGMQLRISTRYLYHATVDSLSCSFLAPIHFFSEERNDGTTRHGRLPVRFDSFDHYGLKVQLGKVSSVFKESWSHILFLTNALVTSPLFTFYCRSPLPLSLHKPRLLQKNMPLQDRRILPPMAHPVAAAAVVVSPQTFPARRIQVPPSNPFWIPSVVPLT